MATYTSALASKRIKMLEEEKAALLAEEAENSTYTRFLAQVSKVWHPHPQRESLMPYPGGAPGTRKGPHRWGPQAFALWFSAED